MAPARGPGPQSEESSSGPPKGCRSGVRRAFMRRTLSVQSASGANDHLLRTGSRVPITCLSLSCLPGLGCPAGPPWFPVGGRGCALTRRPIDLAVPCLRAEAEQTGDCSGDAGAPSIPAGVAASRWSGRRLGPCCGVDGVELGGEQVRIGADQVVELLFDRRRYTVTSDGCGGHDRSSRRHRFRR